MFLLLFSIDDKLKVAETCVKNTDDFCSCCEDNGYPFECISQFKLCLLASSLTYDERLFFSLENPSFKYINDYLEENCRGACDYYYDENIVFLWCDYYLSDNNCPFKVGYSQS
jgi:hypothetical protein